MKDLIGQVATWDAVAIDKVRSMLAGMNQAEAVGTTEELNERTAKAFWDVSLGELRARMNLSVTEVLRRRRRWKFRFVRGEW